MKRTILPLTALSLGIVAAALPLPAQSAPVTHTGVLSPSSRMTIPRYAKFEASWTLPNQTGNPFDPADNDIQFAFSGPNGLRATVPAFWDGSKWCVRYAPPQVGKYSLHVLRGGQSAMVNGLTARSFQCIASRNSGFVRAKMGLMPRFVTDTGTSYYPLGMDVAWTDNSEPAYPALMQTMGNNGLNWVRIWMNNWDGKNLDWAQNKANNPNLGFLLMDVADKWDTIIESADRNNVYVQMTLQNHGEYTAKVDPNWADNPWNVANGGFLQNPDDFFANAEAKRLTKAKFRYIVARWGYSPHLLSYELFNEVQNIRETETHFDDVVGWHKEMAAYIRSLDVNHHLITTSYSDPGSPLAQIGLDYDQIHTYPPDIVSYFAALKPGVPVPTFVGEWGYGGNGSLDEKKTVLHNGLWASLMTPTAGAGQFWYGDAVVANNWWPEFRSATQFVKTLHVPDVASQMSLTSVPSAPGTRGDLSFAPPNGWGQTTRLQIALPSTGAAPDLSGVSSYIQGAGNRNLMPSPIVFTLNCAQPAEFRLEIGTVSANGAHPTLTLDGKPAQEMDFPVAPKEHAARQTLSVQVPAGTHQVGVFNTGPDWFILNRAVVAHYVPPVAALARGTNKTAVFWAYVRPGGPATLSGAAVSFPSLVPGVYQVRLWNITDDRALPAKRVIATAAGLRVALPAFTHDIAGTAVRQ